MIEYIEVAGFGEISAAHRAIRDFNIQAATLYGWGGKARVERRTKKLVAMVDRINQSTHTDEQTDKDAFWQAVMVFQVANKITRDGKLGAATWRKLRQVAGLPEERAVINRPLDAKAGSRRAAVEEAVREGKTIPIGPGATNPAGWSNPFPPGTPQRPASPATPLSPAQWTDSTLPSYVTPPVTLPRPPAPTMPGQPASLRPPDAPATITLPEKDTRTGDPSDDQPPAQTADQPWYKRTGVLVGGGIGLLAIGVGAVLVIHRRRR